MYRTSEVFQLRLAERRLLWIEVPGTAAKDTATAAISAGPCRAVWGRSVIVGMIAVRHPLKDISGHVVEAETRWALNEPTGAVCLPSHWLPQAVAVGVPLANLVAQ